ncbi:hypothetical protein DPMN_119595 [Dreissena polymorpha]|uniref:Uncharacterized protein n=1 Tax=Dreissena polymorpha TaxID=45954 RepID=A0A9D4GMP3_DREPO|nr:hypothetical protein DPMN_119595 [Dreissena polymorpha]
MQTLEGQDEKETTNINDDDLQLINSLSKLKLRHNSIAGLFKSPIITSPKSTKDKELSEILVHTVLTKVMDSQTRKLESYVSDDGSPAIQPRPLVSQKLIDSTIRKGSEDEQTASTTTADSLTFDLNGLRENKSDLTDGINKIEEHFEEGEQSDDIVAELEFSHSEEEPSYSDDVFREQEDFAADKRDDNSFNMWLPKSPVSRIAVLL